MSSKKPLEAFKIEVLKDPNEPYNPYSALIVLGGNEIVLGEYRSIHNLALKIGRVLLALARNEK